MATAKWMTAINTSSASYWVRALKPPDQSIGWQFIAEAES